MSNPTAIDNSAATPNINRPLGGRLFESSSSAHVRDRPARLYLTCAERTW